jgi:hypothetical protein
MTVYKNDKRLGVMVTGLSGEYRWAVTLLNLHKVSARIEAAEAPGSPTPEELAQAAAWEPPVSSSGSDDDEDDAEDDY